MIKECGDAWGRVEVGSCEVSEVVRLTKLLFAVHFNYLPIYLIHFRSYYLSYKLYRRKGNISCLLSLVSLDFIA